MLCVKCTTHCVSACYSSLVELWPNNQSHHSVPLVGSEICCHLLVAQDAETFRVSAKLKLTTCTYNLMYWNDSRWLQAFLCSQISNLQMKRLISETEINRYQHMNAGHFKKTSQYHTIANRFWKCILASAFCFFCSPHALFTYILVLCPQIVSYVDIYS